MFKKHSKKAVKSYISLAIIFSMILPFFSFFNAQAFAKEETKVIIHYKEAAGDEKDWNLWVWPEDKEGAVYPFTGEDEFGKYAEIVLEGNHDQVGFIVRTDDWTKDGEDRFIEIENGFGEAWVTAGDAITYFESPATEVEKKSFDEIELTVHYHRYDGNYDGWNLWIWPDGGDGKEVQFSEEDDFGKVARTTIDVKDIDKIGLITKQSQDGNAWAQKEFGDRFVTKFNGDGTAEIWLIQGQEKIYYDQSKIDLSPKIMSVTLDAFNFFTLETNAPFSLNKHENAGVKINGGKVKIKTVVPFELGATTANKVRIITEGDLDMSENYTVTLEGFGDKEVEIGDIIRSEQFDDRYFYDGDDLGNVYSVDKTLFRVWAPTSSEAMLVTYENWDDENGKEIPMKKAEKGTWTAELEGDQHGLIYTYKVKVNGAWNEAVDPYVRAVTVNGDKGVVVNLTKTNPDKWNEKQKPPFNNPEDAIIYELHVRDLSIHPESGIENKGKFLGVTELGTTGPNGVSTGLDYIKDLGVTHVQFLPIYDYRTVDETKLDTPQFNWGYDPKNYNVPEGSYSTDPYEPTVRIKELKQMVQTLHDNDLRVIMDVVYNHVFAVQEHSFHKLVPGYYFRYLDNGTFANGTGVGNDTASERKMMNKYIVDSIKYWATEYNLDGFRFDLMGIHDVETMNDVRKALNEIDPSIIVIGEGWDLNTPIDLKLKANQKNAGKMKGQVAHFNDHIRDGLKGSVWEDTDNGFVNGKDAMEGHILQGIMGGVNLPDDIATYNDPDQVVTYVEAHDNLTLWDKLVFTNPDASEEEMKQMHKLATSIVLTSQGISFIHAGQEFMRTKGGDHNSYKSSDEVNRLDWERRVEFDKEVEYFKGLVQLRKTYDAFRMTTAEMINENITTVDAPKHAIAYALNTPGQDGQIIVVHNANKEAIDVTLPINSEWELLVNGEKAGTDVIEVVNGDQVSVPALSSYVLVEKKLKSSLTKSEVKSTTTTNNSPYLIPIIAGVLLLGFVGFRIWKRKK